MDEKGTPVAYGYCDVWRFRGEQIAELKAFMIRDERATVEKPITRASGA